MDTDVPMFIIWIAVLITVLYLIIMIVFLVINPSSVTYPIQIMNQASRSINLTYKDQLLIIEPNETATFNLGSENVTITEDAGTEVILNLSDVDRNEYAVSVQNAFSLAATIEPMGEFKSDDPLMCQPISWKFVPGLTGVGLTDCPSNLRQDDRCLSPCTQFGSSNYCCSQPDACTDNTCQETWGAEINYWVLFHLACPTCLITNCDQPNYYCPNSNGTIQYRITFFDS